VLGVGAIAGTYLTSRAPALPEPTGQAAGPEYREATLAIKPSPAVAPPQENVPWTSCLEGQTGRNLADLDLVIAIDTTASMGGVIGDVKARVSQLLASLKAGGGTVRVGLVAYRDYGDAYVVRSFPLSPLSDPATGAGLAAFIGGLSAAGGGDWPEAMASALDAATSMNWRGNVPASIVVIADAPPHPNEAQTANSLAQNFRSKIPGSQLSLIDTGSGGNAMMRNLPKYGGGQYVTYDGHILNSLLPAITGCKSH
jgi:Mg-chelatase subunit ChlD